METSAWLQWRNLGCGSSDIATILGISPWKTKEQLFNERTGKTQAKDISGQWQVQRGVENEPKARAIFELITGHSFPPALHVHPEHECIRASLDGDDGETVLEIKVPGIKTMEDAKKGIVPPHYMCQVQHQLIASGRKKAVFMCYHPEQDDYALVNIEPDLEMQALIIKEVLAFWAMVQSGTYGAQTDYVEVTNLDFVSAGAEWIAAKSALAKAQADMDAAEEKVLQFKDEHKKEVRGTLIKILKSDVKGSIDYARIPELKTVNLEAYRKPSTTRVTIKAIGNEKNNL